MLVRIGGTEAIGSRSDNTVRIADLYLRVCYRCVLVIGHDAFHAKDDVVCIVDQLKLELQTLRRCRWPG